MKSKQNKRQKRLKRIKTVIVPIVFWSIVFLVLLIQTGGIITFNEHTGHVGDTIGGVLGPFLNLAGLLFVWYSLRDQMEMNRKQNKALKRDKQQQVKDTIQQEEERALTICLRLAEEIGKYWKANRKTIKRLWEQENKIVFSDPIYVQDSLQEFWAESEFWAASKDLARAKSFLNVFRETAPKLGNDQRVLIATLFEENYYTHLRKMRFVIQEYNIGAWEDFQHRYPGTTVPPSKTGREVSAQIEAFDQFTDSIGARGQWTLFD